MLRQAHPFHIDSEYVTELAQRAADFADCYWQRDTYEIRGRIARDIDRRCEELRLDRKNVRLALLGDHVMMLAEVVSGGEVEGDDVVLRACDFLYDAALPADVIILDP